jgi:hypothetical protein
MAMVSNFSVSGFSGAVRTERATVAQYSNESENQVTDRFEPTSCPDPSLNFRPYKNGASTFAAPLTVAQNTSAVPEGFEKLTAEDIKETRQVAKDLKEHCIARTVNRVPVTKDFNGQPVRANDYSIDGQVKSRNTVGLATWGGQNATSWQAGEKTMQFGDTTLRIQTRPNQADNQRRANPTSSYSRDNQPLRDEVTIYVLRADGTGYKSPATNHLPDPKNPGSSNFESYYKRMMEQEMQRNARPTQG